ncbi:MAG: hypothetical protein OXL98_02510 [Acidimicrobiaceae bacterium]|nr:hypothetical protein [Acidimicrobiaceae bacterium]
MSPRCRRALGRLLGTVLAVAGAAAAASSCADTADGPLVSEEAVSGEVVTPTAAPPEPRRSDGTAKIGDAQYEFAVACHDRGAGDVVVLGAGDDPVSGGLVELYLEASFVDPYVGLRLADGTLIEPSLDSPLDLYLQDDVIRASAIRFVQDLNLETGEATEVGFGEFEIHCRSYERESPS